MYRIDNSTAATTLPVPGAVGPNPNGFFTDGDPAGGIPATIVDDDWLNAVQEELANAITSDGTELSKTNNAQLKTKLIGRQISSPTLITSSSTYTAPPGTNWLHIFFQAGGGAGAGAQAVSGTNTCPAAPGGGGSWAEAWVAYTAPVPFTVGGAGTPLAGGNGGNGGATSGAGITCPGGPGGTVGTIGVAPNGQGGALSGTPTGPWFKAGQGQAGGLSLSTSSTTGFGGPGGIGGLSGGSGWVGGNTNGVSSNTYGSGGSGSCTTSGNGAVAGGAGVQGCVIVTPYS